MSTVRPGTWQSVRTAAGWHLRLVGANGEPVLTTEVYTDPRQVEETLNLIRRSSQQLEFDAASTVLEPVDER